MTMTRTQKNRLHVINVLSTIAFMLFDTKARRWLANRPNPGKFNLGLQKQLKTDRNYVQPLILLMVACSVESQPEPEQQVQL